MNLLQNIEKLSNLCGVSGCEHMVRQEILSQIQPHCTCEVDPLGNIIAFKKGKTTPKNKILLSAHMDEVGFIITHIEDSGLLRFAAVGGIDSRVVVGKSVEIGKDRIYGVIGTKAVHHQTDKEKSEPIKLDKLFIDIGAEDKQTAQTVVAVGERCVFHSRFEKLGDNKIVGRAFDDRAGCAIMMELIKLSLEHDCYFAFTVQEESGCTGAKTAGYTVKPDISIVVEATTACDIPGTDPDKVVCRLGGGPVISFMDRGTIYDPQLYNFTHKIAKDNGILSQTKEGVFGGNESRSIQTAGSGAKTIAVSLPCRYIHSPCNVLQVEDIHATLALLEKLIPAVAQYE